MVRIPTPTGAAIQKHAKAGSANLGVGTRKGASAYLGLQPIKQENLAPPNGLLAARLPYPVRRSRRM
jgi:hypothetical protein